MKEVEHESIVVTTGYAVNAPRTASGNPVVTLRSAAQEAVSKVLTKNLMIKEERQRLHSMRGEWAHSGSFPVARKQIVPLPRLLLVAKKGVVAKARFTAPLFGWAA